MEGIHSQVTGKSIIGITETQPAFSTAQQVIIQRVARSVDCSVSVKEVDIGHQIAGKNTAVLILRSSCGTRQEQRA
ncbi:hypothetical protein FQZ97_1160940 [compost metagenome]